MALRFKAHIPILMPSTTVPILSSPSFGEAVKGAVAIVGTAADPRFSSYRVEYRAAESATWTALDTLPRRRSS